MRRLILIATTGLALASATAGADECVIRRMPVDLIPNSSDEIRMSLMIGNEQLAFDLHTAAQWSVIPREKIGDLPIQKHRIWMSGEMGKSDETVVLPSLSIGSSTLRKVEMFITPPGGGGARSDQVGVIGAHLLRKFDLDLDFPKYRMAFVTSTGCGSRVVNWRNDGFAAIPLMINDIGWIFVKVKLDGRELIAQLNTGAPISHLSGRRTSSMLSAERDDAPLKANRNAPNSMSDEPSQPLHQFGKLEIGGLAIASPWIGTSNADGSFGWVNQEEGDSFDFILGTHEFRNLHVYVSYPDKVMYVTKGSPELSGDPREDAARPPAPPLDVVDQQLIRPYLDQAESALREGHPEAALLAYTELVAQCPSYSLVYFLRARFEFLQKDGKAALADLDRAIQLLPSYADAYRLRGIVHHAEHDEDGARADADLAVKFDPKSAQSYQTRGIQRIEYGDLEGALADYEHAIALDPNYSAAYSSRGDVLSRLGQLDRAADSIARAVELSPDQPDYHNRRCWYLALMGRLGQALPECSRGLELAPKSAYIHDSRGYVYLRLHRLKEAIADFDAAIDINSNAAHSLYARSLAKQELGDVNGAKADLAAAEKIRPDIAQHFPE